MGNRIVYIDIAKAICIILVVVGHYMPYNHPTWWGIMNDVIYSFHMPLFMFASGFVYISTKKDNQSYGDFIIKKVKRLMVPYFVVSFIVITIKLLTESFMYVQNPKTWVSYVKMFYLPEAGYFLWFIWALWWMFVIIPFFKNKQHRLILLVISVILAYIPFETTEVFCLEQFKEMIIYFMLGVIVYDWKSILSKFKQIPLSAYLLIFITLTALKEFNMGGGNLTIINRLLPFVGIATIISLSKYIEKTWRYPSWLMVISAASYIIYLFHTTFEGFAKAIVLKTPFLKDLSNDFAFTIGAILVVACGVVIPVLLNEYVFKRYNLTRILFGLK